MQALRLALCVFLLVPCAFAQDRSSPLPPDATLLQVDAHGETQRVPDVATIQAGVVTRDVNANAAMRANATHMSAVIAALKQAGVADRDIHTAAISLQPQYSDKQPPRITGYEASNTVSVRLRDMAKIGDVLDALVLQGANQINGPDLVVEKPDAALDEARRAAMQQAKARAELYAETAGLKVRRIVSISESGQAQRTPQAMNRMMGINAAAATPVEAGENTLAIDLSVEFELGR